MAEGDRGSEFEVRTLPPVSPWGGPFGWRAPVRESAVLVPIIARRDGPVVVLTKRGERLRRQAGQVAFPGGLRERDDRSPIDTALREACEEVGIDPASAEVLGELPEVATLMAIAVRPVVATLPEDAALIANPDEVDAVYEIPLRDIERPAFTSHWRVTDEGRLKPVYFWDWRGVVVWGVTARILLCLHERTGPFD